MGTPAGNQHDLEKIVGNDAIFKCAYEALNMDDWSREEIEMYEEYMQIKAQQDAEGYVTPDSKEVSEEVSDAKSGFSDLKELFESERFRLTEESSNSEKEREEREERKALFTLETIRRRREERIKWKMIGMKFKASLEKEKEQKKKKAEVKEGEMKKKAEMKKKG
jgi:hypothetical protein